MAQQNIDFGTFPDDPSADAIRIAFQKVQENFNEIYGSTLDAAVLSVNRNPGRGITVDTPTGNVIVTANISSITVSSSSLKMGVTPNPTTNTAVYTNFNQTLYIDIPNILSITNLSTSGNITAGGNLTSLNASLGNAVTANFFIGDGSGISNVNAITANYSNFAGAVVQNAQPNINSVGILTSLSVIGNANIGNIGTGGLITSIGNIRGGNINTDGLVTAIGNITGGNLITSGLVTAIGNITGGNLITSGLITSTSNITGGNLITSGLVTAIGNITGGNLVTSNLVSAGRLTVTGVSNLGAVSNITITGGSSGEYLRTNGSGVLVWSEVSANTVIFNGTSNVSIPSSGGNVTTSVGGTANVLTVTSTGANIAGTLSVSGNSNVGNIGAIGGIFTTVTGSLTTQAQPNITSTGILTSLSVSGNANVGNIGATNIVGTLTTSSQPNITSVGTLLGLTLGGVLNSNSSIILNTTSASISTLGDISAQGNVTGGNLITGGNVSATGNITSGTGVFTGNGAGLTNINGSNIISGYGNSNVATLLASFGSNTITTTGNVSVGNLNTISNVVATGDVTATQLISTVVSGTQPLVVASTTRVLNLNAATSGVANTVNDPAQPNITSVGTLTSLTVSGQITNGDITTGSSGTPGSLTGNWTLTSGSRLQATYADLAECYAGSEKILPGTVVEFGGDNEVQICNTTMSALVAGIVTTDPAYIMNAGIDCEYPVAIALQGRVPAKVIGPVKRGDMMVSANNGYAMACSSPSMGTVLGKALTNFDGESGVIEIMVGRT